MQELSTTSILSLFETNKEQRQSFVSSVVSSLENGENEPLKTHFQVKCMESIIKLLNKNTAYKKAVLAAAESYGQKSFEYHNSKIEIKETGVNYDYSQCNDPVILRLHEKQKEINMEVEARETMLKTVSPKGMVITDEETGETVTIYPPSKSSTTTVAVTLK